LSPTSTPSVRGGLLLVTAVGVALMVAFGLTLPLVIRPSAPLTVETFRELPGGTPAGPTVELTLRSSGSVGIVNVSAFLSIQPTNRFDFSNVTPQTPLLPGESTTSSTVLVGPIFSCGDSYLITITGKFSTASAFAINITHALSCD
jgi:hypothetical protein